MGLGRSGAAPRGRLRWPTPRRGKVVRSTISTACRVAARWVAALAGPALVSLGLSGCASFWDDVTSRDFHVSNWWTPKPNPLVVLADSHNGDKRAEALRALREPKQFG